jgi:hypothetical protein
LAATGFEAGFGKTFDAFATAVFGATFAEDLVTAFALPFAFATVLATTLVLLAALAADFDLAKPFARAFAGGLVGLTGFALLDLAATLVAGLALPAGFATGLALRCVVPARELVCGVPAFALLLEAVFEPAFGLATGLGATVLTTALPALVTLVTDFNLAFAMREKFRLQRWT